MYIPSKVNHFVVALTQEAYSLRAHAHKRALSLSLVFSEGPKSNGVCGLWDIRCVLYPALHDRDSSLLQIQGTVS